MTYTQEKIAYGIYNLSGAAASTTGAILTEGETRWLYVTITSYAATYRPAGT